MPGTPSMRGGVPGTHRFLSARQGLVEALDLTPARRRRALSDLADAWLASLQPPELPDVALVAVGGYGRQELLPGSDLDVLLLHRAEDPTEIADAVFYPVWDAGVPLDHSVRTPEEARAVAAADLKAMLGLLDARHIAGDADLTDGLRCAVLADWRRTARHRLPELDAMRRERATRVGELPHLVEPDLVEAYGGLRDVLALRAVAASWVADRPHHPEVEEAREWLLVVRDAVHLIAGSPSSRRRRDRLLLADQDAVAAQLGLVDADELLRRVSRAGRVIARASDVTWREVHRARAVLPGPGRRLRRTLAPGIVAFDGEVVLAASQRVDRDPVLPLRVAAAAAQAGLAIGPHTAGRLAAEAPSLPLPWPVEARHLLAILLGAGEGLVKVWEALDAVGLVSRWLPEWERVRFLPQRTPLHRHTVDRHLVETAVRAAGLTGRVSRPDLLLLAALFHDLGKAYSGDHSEAGARLVPGLGRRIGLPDRDIVVLETLVRHHLLLPEAATRRDPDDPETLRVVAEAVRDGDTLDLLAALTEADAVAAGSLAWTSWRATLVRSLVSRVRATLEGAAPPAPAPLQPWQRALAEGGRLAVVVDAEGVDGAARITVVAPDSVGLLATVAGVLILLGFEVRSASVSTCNRMAVQVWRVAGDLDHRVDAAQLRNKIDRVLAGRFDLGQRLAERPPRIGRRGPVLHPSPSAMILAGASATATVVQVRGPDHPGLLYRLAAAVTATGATIRSAVAETLGTEAVDVLYLVDPAGEPLDEAAADTVLDAVRCVLTSVATAPA